MSTQQVTRGDAALAAWHTHLRRAAFVSALALMSLSYVSIRWGLVVVGIPAWWASVGAIFLEVGSAVTASAATTTRPGAPRRSLWAIFFFVMGVAVMANVGHALVSVTEHAATTPVFVPEPVVVAFAAIFAALFPLGGTMLVHVSGVLRAHSVDAAWVDKDAPTVVVRAPDRAAQRKAAPAQPAERAQPTARTEPAQPKPGSAQPVAARATAPDDDHAYQVWRNREDTNPMTAREVADLIGATATSSGTRRRKVWRDRLTAEHHPHLTAVGGA